MLKLRPQLRGNRLAIVWKGEGDPFCTYQHNFQFRQGYLEVFQVETHRVGGEGQTSLQESVCSRKLSQIRKVKLCRKTYFYYHYKNVP